MGLPRRHPPSWHAGQSQTCCQRGGRRAAQRGAPVTPLAAAAAAAAALSSSLSRLASCWLALPLLQSAEAPLLLPAAPWATPPPRPSAALQRCRCQGVLSTDHLQAGRRRQQQGMMDERAALQRSARASQCAGMALWAPTRTVSHGVLALDGLLLCLALRLGRVRTGAPARQVRLQDGWLLRCWSPNRGRPCLERRAICAGAAAGLSPAAPHGWLDRTANKGAAGSGRGDGAAAKPASRLPRRGPRGRTGWGPGPGGAGGPRSAPVRPPAKESAAAARYSGWAAAASPFLVHGSASES